MSAAPNPDLAERATPLGFEMALRRVTDAIAAAGLTVVARIDHADGAALANLVPEDVAARCLLLKAIQS